ISDGLITGTPKVPGAYGVIVTASDDGSSVTASASYTITIVNPPRPVVFTFPPPQGATLGQSYSFNFSASGPTAMTFSATGTLPAGLAPVTTNGLLAGTPTVTGSYPIVVQVVDAAGQKATQNFTIEVFAHGFAPVGNLHDGRGNHAATLLSN